MLSLGPDGVAAAAPLRGKHDAVHAESREWQAAQLRRTGYCTPQAELGHAIVIALRELGYPLTVAAVAGQLGAVATAYNWQGNTRIAQIIGRSKRTVQRARARLESDKLIVSELLLTGDMLDGQRAPVRHPQVVRDVSRLQRLARTREQQRAAAAPAERRRRRRRKGPSAAEVPRPTPAPRPMTPEEFRAMGEAHPEFASFLGEMAAAAAMRGPGKPPPNAAPEMPPEEIDEFDRATAELERILRERRERGPPQSG